MISTATAQMARKAAALPYWTMRRRRSAACSRPRAPGARPSAAPSVPSGSPSWTRKLTVLRPTTLARPPPARRRHMRKPARRFTASRRAIRTAPATHHWRSRRSEKLEVGQVGAEPEADQREHEAAESPRITRRRGGPAAARSRPFRYRDVDARDVRVAESATVWQPCPPATQAGAPPPESAIVCRSPPRARAGRCAAAGDSAGLARWASRKPYRAGDAGRPLGRPAGARAGDLSPAPSRRGEARSRLPEARSPPARPRPHRRRG